MKWLVRLSQRTQDRCGFVFGEDDIISTSARGEERKRSQCDVRLSEMLNTMTMKRNKASLYSVLHSTVTVLTWQLAARWVELESLNVANNNNNYTLWHSYSFIPFSGMVAIEIRYSQLHRCPTVSLAYERVYHPKRVGFLYVAATPRWVTASQASLP